MRNNGKTSAIDDEGYRSTFDMILFSRVGLLASHDRHVVYLGRRTSEKWWRRRGTSMMVVELGWWLGFSFEVKLAWGCVG
jgi:hypothetical protein